MNERDAADFRKVLNPDALARAGLLVAEGPLVVQRLLASGRFHVRGVLATPSAAEALVRITHEMTSPLHVVDQADMDGIVGFRFHRGCLAIAERPPVPTLASTDLSGARRLVVLEGVADPDNVGGIFRSAAAFGVELFVLGHGCADPWYRKAIRTSMAATLEMPFVIADELPSALALCRARGLRVLALTTTRTAVDIDIVAREGVSQSRLALLLGSEGSGLTGEALAAADIAVRIRMTDRVDSLNVTVAASIALHRLF